MPRFVVTRCNYRLMVDVGTVVPWCLVAGFSWCYTSIDLDDVKESALVLLVPRTPWACLRRGCQRQGATAAGTSPPPSTVTSQWAGPRASGPGPLPPPAQWCGPLPAHHHTYIGGGGRGAGGRGAGGGATSQWAGPRASGPGPLPPPAQWCGPLPAHHHTYTGGGRRGARGRGRGAGGRGQRVRGQEWEWTIYKMSASAIATARLHGS